MLKKFWDEFGVYAGILGLIVDCIALWGYLGVKLNVRLNEISGFPEPITLSIISLNASQEKLLLIITASAIIFSYAILVILLPKKGYNYLCDYSLDLDEKLETITKKYAPDYSKVGQKYSNLFRMYRQGVGMSDQFFGIGLYSVLLNFSIVSPVVLIWLRSFFLFPSNKYIFLTVFSTLLLVSIYLLVIQRLANYFNFKNYITGLFILVEILALLIVAYGFTIWNLQSTMANVGIAISAVFVYFGFAFLLKNKVVIFEVTEESMMTHQEYFDLMKQLMESVLKK